MRRTRHVRGAVYNENLVRYDWHAPEPNEESCNQIVHVKLEKEVTNLKNQVVELQNQLMGVANLDPDEWQN